MIGPVYYAAFALGVGLGVARYFLLRLLATRVGPQRSEPARRLTSAAFAVALAWGVMSISGIRNAPDVVAVVWAFLGYFVALIALTCRRR